MYVHNTIVSAGTYLKYITGKHWDLKRLDQLQEVADILAQTNNEGYWDYPLDEIEHIMRENLTGVVLVDIYGTTIDDSSMHHIYRWFALPDDSPDAIKDALHEEPSESLTHCFN